MYPSGRSKLGVDDQVHIARDTCCENSLPLLLATATAAVKPGIVRVHISQAAQGSAAADKVRHQNIQPTSLVHAFDTFMFC